MGSPAAGTGGGTTTPTAGGGAGGGGSTDGSNGGGGGGYAAVLRGGTFLVQAGGGGGGGGVGDGGSPAGGAGGAGGGTSGVAGSRVGSGGFGGGGGTTSAGGTGGSTGGASGSANTGGVGAVKIADSGSGGGGGGGRFGGGGGGSGLVTGTNTTLTAGSGTTPGNNADPDYAASAGIGGAAGANGNAGRIVITPSSSGGGAGATFAAPEDTALAGLAKNTPTRLRFEVSNEGTASSGSVTYELEYSTSTSGPWTTVPDSATTEHWETAASTNITDGEATSDIASGLTNENTTFVAGELRDTLSATGAITLAVSEFTELEFSIQAASDAILGGIYYFRLTNAGDAADFSYPAFAQVTLAGSTRLRSIGTDATDLNVSARTVEIAGTTATFGGSMPGNVGVGDILQYQVAATWYGAFISGRTSDTVYTVQNASGGTPQAAAAATAVGVYRAYTSLFNWEAQDENDSLNDAIENFDTSTDLAAANVVMQVAAYADGPDTDANQVSISSGWVTGPNNYIRIFTPVSTGEVGASQRHAGIAGTGYVRRPTGAAAGSYDVLEIDTNYVRLDGLEFDGSSLTGTENLYGINISTTAGSTDIRVEHCLVHDLTNSNATPASARYVRGIYSVAGNSQDLIKLANNLVYGIANINTNSGSSSHGVAIKQDLGLSYVYSNVVFDISSPANTAATHGMRLGGGATHNVKNNYVGQLTCATCTYTPAAYRQGESAPINMDGNVSFDASADDFVGANNVINQATYSSYFVDVTPGSENFHLKADSNSLWGAYGEDLDNGPNLPVTTDIDGEARDTGQPDIGADEFSSTGMSTTSADGIWSGTERYIHYANGNYWAIFYDGSEAVIFSSTTGRELDIAGERQRHGE